MTRSRRLLICTGAALTATSCSTPKASTDTPATTGADSAVQQAPAPENPATAVRPDSAGHLARIARLESEARALAKVTGCTSAGQCRTAPVGERGCGGPRSYIVYCAASTDSGALFRKLGELKDAETKYNQASGMVSTCEMRMPPAVSASGGSCRAATP